MASRIVVAYPFHPLHGQPLEVIRTPRCKEGAVTVRGPGGKRLKIPTWMLEEDASRVQLANQAVISAAALQALDELLNQLQGADRGASVDRDRFHGGEASPSQIAHAWQISTNPTGGRSG